MNHFLSCDWGYHNLQALPCRRKRLLNPGPQEKSLEGIAATYNSWLETGDADSKARADFLPANHFLPYKKVLSKN